MLLDFNKLVQDFHLNINGIIHIGSHYGQEYEIFKKHGCKSFLMFEPIPWVYDKLLEHLKKCGTSEINMTTVNCAIGSKDNNEVILHLDNRQQASSSILAPVKHLGLYPDVKFNKTLGVPQTSLDNYFNNNKSKINISDFNMVNVDVNGYELEVFKGAQESLKHIDYIMTEVNKDETYKDCCRIEQLDLFLGKYNFNRVVTHWPNQLWGDAFYVKT